MKSEMRFGKDMQGSLNQTEWKVAVQPVSQRHVANPKKILICIH